MIKILSYYDNSLTLLLTDKDAGFANSLRRVMISEVPTLAVSEIRFYTNTSVVTDEIIAQRIGLTVLNSEIINTDINIDNHSNVIIEDSDESESFDEEFMMYLDVECKGKEIIVTTGMLTSDNDLIYPIYPDIVITKLIEGQRLKLSLVVMKGIGKTHSKWSPVTTVCCKEKPAYGSYELSLESVGNLEPHIIVNLALKILSEKHND